MAYVTLEEVLDQAPQIKINATSRPDTVEARKIVQAVEDYVNSVLKGLGYTTPVTLADSPKAFAILKDIVLQGSIAKILKAMFYGVRNPNDVGANEAYREFTSKLAQLSNQNDPMVLEDAVKPNVAEHVRSELDSNISDLVLEDVMWRPTRDQVF